MKVATIIKTIFTIIVALTLFFTWDYEPESSSQPSKPSSLDQKTASPKRVSRFLEQNNKDHGYNHSYYKNPRAADHCHKDHEICELNGYQNATCCNNKCINLGYDSDHCGRCKKKCLFTQVCCRGECVDTAYDKRHCGRCHNKCFTGQYCIYGMCDYP